MGSRIPPSPILLVSLSPNNYLSAKAVVDIDVARFVPIRTDFFDRTRCWGSVCFRDFFWGPSLAGERHGGRGNVNCFELNHAPYISLIFAMAWLSIPRSSNPDMAVFGLMPESESINMYEMSRTHRVCQ